MTPPRPLTPPEPVVLLGRVVTFDEATPVVEDGAVYIGADERIHAIRERKLRGPTGFSHAPRIRTG